VTTWWVITFSERFGEKDGRTETHHSITDSAFDHSSYEFFGQKSPACAKRFADMPVTNEKCQKVAAGKKHKDTNLSHSIDRQTYSRGQVWLSVQTGPTNNCNAVGLGSAAM